MLPVAVCVSRCRPSPRVIGVQFQKRVELALVADFVHAQWQHAGHFQVGLPVLCNACSKRAGGLEYVKSAEGDPDMGCHNL